MGHRRITQPALPGRNFDGRLVSRANVSVLFLVSRNFLVRLQPRFSEDVFGLLFVPKALIEKSVVLLRLGNQPTTGYVEFAKISNGHWVASAHVMVKVLHVGPWEDVDRVGAEMYNATKCEVLRKKPEL